MIDVNKHPAAFQGADQIAGLGPPGNGVLVVSLVDGGLGVLEMEGILARRVWLLLHSGHQVVGGEEEDIADVPPQAGEERLRVRLRADEVRELIPLPFRAEDLSEGIEPALIVAVPEHQERSDNNSQRLETKTLYRSAINV